MLSLPSSITLRNLVSEPLQLGSFIRLSALEERTLDLAGMPVHRVRALLSLAASAVRGKSLAVVSPSPEDLAELEAATGADRGVRAIAKDTGVRPLGVPVEARPTAGWTAESPVQADSPAAVHVARQEVKTPDPVPQPPTNIPQASAPIAIVPALEPKVAKAAEEAAAKAAAEEAAKAAEEAAAEAAAAQVPSSAVTTSRDTGATTPLDDL